MIARWLLILPLAFLSRQDYIRKEAFISADAPFVNQYAVTLDGVNEYIEMPTSTAINATGAMTIWCWTRWNATTNGRGLMSKQNNNPFLSWQLQGSGGGYRIFLFLQSSTGTAQNGIAVSPNPTTPVAGTWFWWAIVFDGSKPTNQPRLRYALNSGTTNAFSSYPDGIENALADSAAPLRIGAGVGASIPANVNMDECGFSKFALSDSCLSEIYNGGNSSIDVRNVSCASQISAAWHLGDTGDSLSAFKNYVNPGTSDGVGQNMEAGDITTDRAP